MRAPALLRSLLLCLGLSPALALESDPEATWRGGVDEFWTTAGNWLGLTPPSDDGTAVVIFSGPDSGGSYYSGIKVDVDIDVASMLFESGTYYSFYSYSSRTITLREGLFAQGEESYSNVFFSDLLGITTVGDTTWNLAYSNRVTVDSILTNTGTLTVAGEGTLQLGADNRSALAGDIVVLDAQLALANDHALGDATLVLGSADAPGDHNPTLIVVDDNREIANDVIIHGQLSLGAEYAEDEYDLAFTGTVTLADDTVIKSEDTFVSFEGTLTELVPGTHLTIDTDGLVLIGGTSLFTGGLDVERGAVVFTDGDALPPPASSFTAEIDAYIGLLEDNSADVAAAMATFLSQFDPFGFEGTIGFDTDPEHDAFSPPPPANVYTGDINLAALGLLPQVTLGSVSYAELSGTITPVDNVYRFGNGGGTLYITSTLTDDGPNLRGVDAVSPSDRPLTVYLNSAANSFSGEVTAQHSAVIFGHAPGTLPAGVFLRPDTGGYIGLQDATVSLADYLARFDAALDRGIIGFDSLDAETHRTIADPIDLSAFIASAPDFYLGTATRVSLGGTITLPTHASAYRFAGYKGGSLSISSSLSDGAGPRAVIIGDYDSPATGVVEDAVGRLFSSVTLDAANTYSGGTFLEAGELVVTQNHALGTGSLHAAGRFSDQNLYWGYDYDAVETDMPVLFAGAVGLTLPNAIELDSWLNVRTSYDSGDVLLRLDGDISGDDGIWKSGLGTLSLAGDNTFAGGIYVQQGTLKLLSDTAGGSGPVGFGAGYGQQLEFTSANPIIGGLYDGDDDDEYSVSSTYVTLASGSTLTLELDEYDYFNFSGSISGDAALIIAGGGQQNLYGSNYYSGGTIIRDGATVTVGNSSALGYAMYGTTAVTLDDGTLLLSDSGDISANVTFGAGGGVIGGNGRLFFTNTLTVGTGASLAPGFSVGHLELGGEVDFAPGGLLEIEFAVGGENTLIADVIFVETLALSATAVNPFQLKLLDDEGAFAAEFDPSLAQSWLVLGTLDAFAAYDRSAFELLVAPSILAVADGGSFDLFLGGAATIESLGLGDGIVANQLFVTFTPVPEPSTYALLGTGLAVLWWQSRRRLRRRD